MFTLIRSMYVSAYIKQTMSKTMLVEEKTLLNKLIGSVDTTGFLVGTAINLPSEFLSAKGAFGNDLLYISGKHSDYESNTRFDQVIDREMEFA